MKKKDLNRRLRELRDANKIDWAKIDWIKKKGWAGEALEIVSFLSKGESKYIHNLNREEL